MLRTSFIILILALSGWSASFGQSSKIFGETDFLLPSGVQFPTNIMRPMILDDLDGDGVPEIAALCIQQIQSFVCIYSGRTSSVLHVPNFSGDTAGFTFRDQVVSVGDVDGDGTPDYGMLFRESATAPMPRNALSIHSGSSGVTLGFVTYGFGEAIYSTFSLEPSLPSAGPRFVLATLDQISGFGRSVRFRIWDQSLTTPILDQQYTRFGAPGGALDFTSNPELFPRAVAVPDKSGDGVDDVVVFRRNQSFAEIFDGTTGDFVVDISPRVNYGVSKVQRTDDLDGDGVDDLVVVQQANAAGLSAGLIPHVFAYYSSATLTEIRAVEFSNAIGIDSAALSEAVDLDGDGIRDIEVTNIMGTLYFSGADGGQIGKLTVRGVGLVDYRLVEELDGDGFGKILALHELPLSQGGPGVRTTFEGFAGARVVDALSTPVSSLSVNLTWERSMSTPRSGRVVVEGLGVTGYVLAASTAPADFSPVSISGLMGSSSTFSIALGIDPSGVFASLFGTLSPFSRDEYPVSLVQPALAGQTIYLQARRLSVPSQTLGSDRVELTFIGN